MLLRAPLRAGRWARWAWWRRGRIEDVLAPAALFAGAQGALGRGRLGSLARLHAPLIAVVLAVVRRTRRRVDHGALGAQGAGAEVAVLLPGGARAAKVGAGEAAGPRGRDRAREQQQPDEAHAVARRVARWPAETGDGGRHLPSLWSSELGKQKKREVQHNMMRCGFAWYGWVRHCSGPAAVWR